MTRNNKEADMIRIAALLDPACHNLLSPDNKQASELHIIREGTSNLEIPHSLFLLLPKKVTFSKK